MKLEAVPIQGEPTRFHVTSEVDGQQPYLVDLLHYDGNGKCACSHFQFRLEPLLSRGYRDEDLLCKHLRAARLFWCRDVLHRMAQQEAVAELVAKRRLRRATLFRIK